MPRVTKASTERRVALLDAGLEIVAEHGLQALTHRAVEARAGVSHGVTTYHFSTREAMIRALFEHVCERQIAWITRMYSSLWADLAGDDPGSIDREAFTRRAVQMLVAERTLTLARYELYLNSARDPELARLTATLRERHVQVQAQMFRAVGAADPEFAAHRLLSATEGLLIYQLSVPEPDFEHWAPQYLVAITDLLQTLTRPPRP